jgi:hypothetical protein
MTKHFEFKIKDDDSILRDGESYNHRLMLRDSISNPIQDALDATEALKVRDAAILAASRKPGWHFADSAVDSRAEARAAARQASYDEYSREVSNAWRRKDTVIVDAAVDPRAAWHAARDASRAAGTNDARRAVMDAAYAQYDSEITDAWRKPAQF